MPFKKPRKQTKRFRCLFFTVPLTSSFGRTRHMAWSSTNCYFQIKNLTNGHKMELQFTFFTNRPPFVVASNIIPNILFLFWPKNCTSFVTIWLSSRPVRIRSSLFCVCPYPVTILCSWIVANPNVTFRRSQSCYKRVLLLRLNFSQVCSQGHTICFCLGVIPIKYHKLVAGSFVKAPAMSTFYQAVQQEKNESAICQEDVFFFTLGELSERRS